MCGIAGIVRFDRASADKAEVQVMLDRIDYRGPDGQGVYCESGIGFGHVRLAILDLSSRAAQPMVSQCGRYVFTYNGEIYNYKDLRSELKGRGIHMHSTGDTEVLLEYLGLFGVKEALGRIEGMFAFALWDRQERVLTLARDRHGIKPLVYRRSKSGTIHFASEMKALFHRTSEPDPVTLNAMLCGLGGTGGEATVYRDILWVPAGEWLSFGDGGRLDKNKFFHVSDFVDRQLWEDYQSLTSQEAVGRFGQEIEASVDATLLSDAPVCVFSSGGVDSSMIAALAARRNREIKLFHANVLGDSEVTSARELARALKLDLLEVEVSDQDVIDYTPIATYHYEMPIGYHHGGCVPFLMVSKLAGSAGMKVVLTGEGSDEYFLGYPQLAIRQFVNSYSRITASLQKLIHRIPALGALLWPHHQDHPAHHLRRLLYRFELEERRGLATEAFSFVESSAQRDLHVQVIDMVVGNVRSLLHRNDRLGMSSGLESRFPFLGHGVSSFAMNMPNRFKIRGSLRFGDWRHPFVVDKWVVRELAARYLPDGLAGRKKFGLRSTFYKRVEITKDFYSNGFLCSYYGLNGRALDCLLGTMSEFWKEQMHALEVWGQLFCLGWSLGEAQEHGRRSIRVRD